MAEIFEHLNNDYSNLPKNLKDFKNYLGDIYPGHYESFEGLIRKYTKHNNPEVSEPALELLDYFKNMTLSKLNSLDMKEKKLASGEVMQVANNPEYKRKYRGVG